MPIVKVKSRCFVSRGYFTQIMQREIHHRCYRKWQETFRVERLYQEVSDEVREMHNYLMMVKTERIERAQAEQRRLAQEEQTRRVEERQRVADAEAARERAAQQRAQELESRISYLGVIIGGPALVVSFLGINIAGWTTASEGLSAADALWWSAGGGLELGVVILLLVWMLRLRQQDEK